jgi:diadenosine tetraphosphate (Ap4A) HIT family hydrolase
MGLLDDVLGSAVPGGNLAKPIAVAAAACARHSQPQGGFLGGLFCNIGEVAGQTIFYCHIHLIPRRIGDVANPNGRRSCDDPGKSIVLEAGLGSRSRPDIRMVPAADPDKDRDGREFGENAESDGCRQ